MNVENVLDEMIDDLNAVNDDFINNYFDDEFEKSLKQEEIEEFIDETIESNEEENNELEIIDSQIETNLLEDEELEEVSLNEIPEELEKTDFEEETIEEKPKTFSYNEILDRLDKKEKIDINNPDDILKLIGNSSDSEEFFEELEKVSEDDK